MGTLALGGKRHTHDRDGAALAGSSRRLTQSHEVKTVAYLHLTDIGAQHTEVSFLTPSETSLWLQIFVQHCRHATTRADCPTILIAMVMAAYAVPRECPVAAVRLTGESVFVGIDGSRTGIRRGQSQTQPIS